MSGYCPAGKCECENYMKEWPYTEPICQVTTPLRNKNWIVYLEGYEACPWPPRQVLVHVDLKKIMGAIPDMPEYEKQDPFKFGQLATLQQCREAVEKRADQIGGDYGTILRLHGLEAISKVEEEIK